ncbi:MAG: hypothetical protein H7281_15285 [Bacteriovorax sp.]|nr:hypothetical protein [Bacteriovorax sp.]
MISTSQLILLENKIDYLEEMLNSSSSSIDVAFLKLQLEQIYNQLSKELVPKLAFS